MSSPDNTILSFLKERKLDKKNTVCISPQLENLCNYNGKITKSCLYHIIVKYIDNNSLSIKGDPFLVRPNKELSKITGKEDLSITELGKIIRFHILI
jgi:hypothetical protein